MRLWHGVDPQMVGPLGTGALQPDLTGLGVPMFIGATGVQNLLGAHRGIADKYRFVIGAIAAQNVPSGRLIIPAPRVVAPNAFVKAVVKIKRHQMFELGARGGKQLFHQSDIGVHRAANIKEDQYLDRISAFGAQLHIQPALPGGGGNGGGQIKCALPRAGPLPQGAQGEFQAARANFSVIVKKPLTFCAKNTLGL